MWWCVETKSLEEDKTKLQTDISVLEKKVTDLTKSRDVQIRILEDKLKKLQQEAEVSLLTCRLALFLKQSVVASGPVM